MPAADAGRNHAAGQDRASIQCHGRYHGVSSKIASGHDLHLAQQRRTTMDNPVAAPAGLSPVVVRNVANMHLAQSVMVDGHEIRADEPKELGGDQTGPSPHGLLLAALGTCTAMTLRLYADRKGWDIGNVTVGLGIRWEKVEGSAERRVVIERVIESDRALLPEQQARLLEIAEKCPVHRTLMSDKVITTRLSAPTAEV
jgi:uncharacterized OsmC-like protein